MAREHVNQRLDEQERRIVDAFQRDLSALLALEPSPEFRAKVRQRIALAPAQRPWRTWSWALVAAALVVVVAGAAILMRAGDAGHRPSATTAVRRPLDAGGAVPPKPEATKARGGTPESVEPALGRAGSSRLRRVATHLEGRDGLEVIVDRAQADAVRRLLTLAGRAPRTAVAQLPADPAVAAAIDIAPAAMVVQPLAVPGLDITNKGVER